MRGTQHMNQRIPYETWKKTLRLVDACSTTMTNMCNKIAYHTP